MSIALLAKGLREAGQIVNNAFYTFADKPEVDYSQKEQKHPFTKAVLAPMKAVKKLLVSMELHLDASIDKLDNLAMNVQFDKEKRMEQTKDKEQKAPDTEREIKQYLQMLPQWGRLGATSVTPFLLLPNHPEGYILLC